jgi:hypothetical protein
MGWVWGWVCKGPCVRTPAENLSGLETGHLIHPKTRPPAHPEPLSTMIDPLADAFARNKGITVKRSASSDSGRPRAPRESDLDILLNFDREVERLKRRLAPVTYHAMHASNSTSTRASDEVRRTRTYVIGTHDWYRRLAMRTGQVTWNVTNSRYLLIIAKKCERNEPDFDPVKLSLKVVVQERIRIAFWPKIENIVESIIRLRVDLCVGQVEVVKSVSQSMFPKAHGKLISCILRVDTARVRVFMLVAHRA